MYPATYYENFMRYEANHDVFVAMPFSTEFRTIYDDIIKPAIELVPPLRAKILNRGTTGAIDIHEEIYDAIMHSRLVIADVTVQAHYLDGGRKKWQPNANVAYEVGLACAWRNPDSVLLIHQAHKNHSYSFDLQSLRHVSYSRDPESVSALSEEISRMLDQSSYLAKHHLEKIESSLSSAAVQFMNNAKGFLCPTMVFKTANLHAPGSAYMDTLKELLRCHLLKVQFQHVQANRTMLFIYRWTELGIALMLNIGVIDKRLAALLATQAKGIPEGIIPSLEFMHLGPETYATDAVAPSA